MLDRRQKYIQKLKKSVDELIKVVGAKIDFESMQDSKWKNALKTKKKAISEAKDTIINVLEIDYHQQNWARKKINEVIKRGEDAIDHLIDSLEEPILNDEHLKIDDNSKEIIESLESKSIARKDASEIMSIINDFNRILEEDEIVLKETEFQGGYAEIYADKFEKQGTKSGYNKEHDCIVIDPNGTIGEIIELRIYPYKESGLRIALPKKPDDKYILNNAQKQEDQVWNRQKQPTGLNIKSAKSYEPFIDEEYDKKRRGIWFYNNGIPEYITGAHWFLLQHCQTEADGKYYFFSKAQQKVFWFMEACWCDERCFGMILEKIRRFGMTHCALAFRLCKSTSAKDKLCGMTSKTDDDAKINFAKETKMFRGLPFYLKPLCLDEKSKSKLEFMSPGEKLNKSNRDKEIVDASLGTINDYLATKVDSYDGTAQYIYIADEFSKWKKERGNTLTHWDMVKKCLTKGANITGKALIISTIENVSGNEAYDEDAQAGDRYKYLYENSDPNKRDKNGRTVSGMYKLFISCYEHYEGFIDKYGHCVIEDPEQPVQSITGGTITIGVKHFIANEIAALKGNLKAIYEYKRKTPILEEDGFAIAEGACAFNQANIQAQMSYNDSLPVSPVRTGNLGWKGGIPDCREVIWKDDPNGRFKITWMPSQELQNSVARDTYGKLIPLNTDIGCFGIDPYRTHKTTDGKGSKGAMHGFSNHNSKGAPNNKFFLEYLHRPDTKEIFNEDMICAMVFFGMPALIESNVNNLLEEMERRGYSKFSMKRPDKSRDDLSYDEKRLGGINTAPENVRQMMSSAIEAYIEDFVGDEGGMYFNRTLSDWLKFDDKNRTKRDASISSSLALIGATSKGKRKEHIPENNSRGMIMLTQFDNTGISTRIRQ
jgi:hypothetical protein